MCMISLINVNFYDFQHFHWIQFEFLQTKWFLRGLFAAESGTTAAQCNSVVICVGLLLLFIFGLILWQLCCVVPCDLIIRSLLLHIAMETWTQMCLILAMILEQQLLWICVNMFSNCCAWNLLSLSLSLFITVFFFFRFSPFSALPLHFGSDNRMSAAAALPQKTLLIRKMLMCDNLCWFFCKSIYYDLIFCWRWHLACTSLMANYCWWCCFEIYCIATEAGTPRGVRAHKFTFIKLPLKA